MFLGDGGHLRWGSFAIGDFCDGGPESRFGPTSSVGSSPYAVMKKKQSLLHRLNA